MDNIKIFVKNENEQEILILMLYSGSYHVISGMTVVSKTPCLSSTGIPEAEAEAEREAER